MTPSNDRPDPADHSDWGDPGGGRGEDRPVSLEDLIALRDGDLDDDQARRVRERIERDPEAVAGLLDELDETDAILEQLRSHPPPPELSERIESAIAEEAARGRGDDQPDSDSEDPDTEQ